MGQGPKWAKGPWDRAGSRAHDLLGEHLTKKCTLKIEAMLLIVEAILLIVDVFMKTKRMRTDITRRMVVVSCRDLRSEAQSCRDLNSGGAAILNSGGTAIKAPEAGGRLGVGVWGPKPPNRVILI